MDSDTRQKIIEDIDQAMIDRRIVAIRYRRSREEVRGAKLTDRAIAPIAWTRIKDLNVLYIYAWCELRSEYRTFRLDGILSVWSAKPDVSLMRAAPFALVGQTREVKPTDFDLFGNFEMAPSPISKPLDEKLLVVADALRDGSHRALEALIVLANEFPAEFETLVKEYVGRRVNFAEVLYVLAKSNRTTVISSSP